jgi:hypothetical protein
MTDQNFAAAAAAHSARQVEVLRGGVDRLREKAERFDLLAATARTDIEIAEAALTEAEAELAEWTALAASASPPEPGEQVAADAEAAEGTGEGGL